MKKKKCYTPGISPFRHLLWMALTLLLTAPLLSKGQFCAVISDAQTTNIAETSATLTWTPVSGASSYNVRWHLNGSNTWDTIKNASPGLVLKGLKEETWYRWQVQAVCSPTSSSGWQSLLFNTTGGCIAPINDTAEDMTTDQTLLSWSSVTGATSYNVMWQESNTASWTTVTGITSDGMWLTGLLPGRKYVFQVQTACGSGTSNYNPMTVFTTPTYCAAKGSGTKGGYIRSVQVQSFGSNPSQIHYSGDDGGYADYSTYMFSAGQGQSNTILMTPAFPDGHTEKEYWQVWIDLNMNGEFEYDELMVSASGTGTVSSNFFLPEYGILVPTGMRVRMSNNPNNTNPCGSVDSGDVQDFYFNYTSYNGPNKAITANVSVDSSIAFKSPDPANTVSLAVVPNPLPRSVAPTVIYNLRKDGNVVLKMIDINGKTLQMANLGYQNTGQHQYLLNGPRSSLSAGFYIVIVEQDMQIIARSKFIVQ